MRIINIARGGIVDEEALLDSLESGHCHGAALDVFAEEPPRAGSVSARLIQHPSVICTPHLGASTVEAQERVAREIAEQLIDLVQVQSIVLLSPLPDQKYSINLEQGRQAVGVANAPVLGRSMVDSNKPWMQLSQALGYLARRLADGVLDVPGKTKDRESSVELVAYGKRIFL